MRRALIWLNLCGREAVQHKLKNGLKTQKMHFLPFLSLCRRVSQPDRLSHINLIHRAFWRMGLDYFLIAADMY